MKSETEMPGHVVKTLAELDAEIKVRQNETQQLLQCRGSLMELYGIPALLPMGNVRAAVAAAPEKPANRKYQKRAGSKTAPPLPTSAPATPAILNGDKPTTLGGAMKAGLRGLPQPFTYAQLRDALEADPDYAKLLATCSPSTFYANLNYWSKTGKLTKSGDGDEATYRNVEF